MVQVNEARRPHSLSSTFVDLKKQYGNRVSRGISVGSMYEADMISKGSRTRSRFDFPSVVRKTVAADYFSSGVPASLPTRVQEKKTLRNMLSPASRQKLFNPKNICDELGGMKDEVRVIRRGSLLCRPRP